MLTGIPPLKAFSVFAEQTGSEIHMVEGLFGIDKLIDGLMADGFTCNIMGDPPRCLLRTQAEGKFLLDVAHNHLVFEPRSFSSAPFAFDSTPMGTMRQINIVHWGLITLKFPADGAFVPSHNPCNLTQGYPLCPKHSNDVPFFTG